MWLGHHRAGTALNVGDAHRAQHGGSIFLLGGFDPLYRRDVVLLQDLMIYGLANVISDMETYRLLEILPRPDH